jgi:hypothetical protein
MTHRATLGALPCKAYLLGEGDHNRKEWLENRLEELADIFAVAVGVRHLVNLTGYPLRCNDPRSRNGAIRNRSIARSAC